MFGNIILVWIIWTAKKLLPFVKINFDKELFKNEIMTKQFGRFVLPDVQYDSTYVFASIKS